MAKHQPISRKTVLLADVLQQAVAAHQQGRLQDAESGYRRVLAADPDQFDALRLLGLICYQQGKFAEALRWLAAALKTNDRSVAALSDQGLILAALDRHEEALASYRRVLAIAPENADALCRCGNACLALARHSEALQSYDAALKINPDHRDALYGRGTLLIGQGSLAEGVASLQRLVGLQPEHLSARNNLGQGLLLLDRAAEALPHFEHVLATDPHHVSALFGRARALAAAGSTAEATATSRQALALAPQHPEINKFHAIMLLRLDRHEEALACADAAIAANPDDAGAHNSRGTALTGLDRFEEAVASYDRAIALKPDYVEALSNRGHVLHALRRFEDAVASCDAAIAFKPDYADAYSNRGNALVELRRLDEAFADYERAVALAPGLAAGWLGRGNLLLDRNRADEALASFNRVLELQPDSYKAIGQLGWYHGRRGEIEAAVACYDRALAVKPDFAVGLSNRIFAIDFLPGAGFAEQQAARRLWWDRVGVPIAARTQIAHDNDRDPRRRIVLGYVSSDFREHSAAFCFGAVLRNHDRARFEVVCYSCSMIEDESTQAFRAVADRWRNTAQLSDDALAAQIRADNIDILIDLSGHSSGNRLGVFARKPAPVQVTAWGHATGTGIPLIDYLFGDSVTIPTEARPLFAEKIYDLPCSITLGEPPAGVFAPDPPMQKRGTVTFGVFNRFKKISDDAIAIWARILHSVPQARLMLKDGAYDDGSLRAGLTDRFAVQGIAPDRLAFRGRTARRDHLAAFAEVDIGLDPFPQNGGVSTWEALQMGVPVVGLLGSGPANRLSASILTAIGLDEWVADSTDDYVALALKYAAMPDRLQDLRCALPDRIAASPAGNSVLYTRAVEQGYSTMWAEYCRRRI